MPSLTISTGAAELFPANSNRKSFVIQNEDTTDAIFVKRERSEGTTVSATDHDLRIGPGGAMALNELSDGRQAIQGRWTAIAAANTPRVSYFETEDILR